MTTTTTQSASAPPVTTLLDVPGATIAYDVRTSGSTSEPPLLIIGSPMGASGFRTLAGLLSDRTIVTYDPRGVDRSTKDDPATESDPRQHADDIHRVIQAVGGPVDVFASSGAAINTLALLASHPEDVRTLIAHEPPAAAMVPDREAALAAAEHVAETYQRAGFGLGMAKFILLVGHQGEIPAGFFDGPDPDPAMFHLPVEDDGHRTDPLLFQNIRTCTHFEPDFEALAAVKDRLVIAAGEESEGQLARRGGEAIAARLGLEPVVFPSGHGGFIGDEYGPGQGGKPVEFAARLREVLESAGQSRVARGA
ncbi:MAG TPA: hypothetical protein VGJ17_04755 [Candidatus Limnocylindrales bacterium]